MPRFTPLRADVPVRETIRCRLEFHGVGECTAVQYLRRGQTAWSWSGVFLCAIMAIMKASVSSEPLGDVASCSSLFTNLTAASALPFDWAKYAKET